MRHFSGTRLPHKFAHWKETRRDISRPTVTAEKKVDPGACLFQIAVRRRNVSFEILDPAGRLRALVNRHPNAGFGFHFALAILCSTARAVAEILRTGLRADVFHVPQHTISAGLASKQGGLDGELESLETPRESRPLVDPAEELREEVPECAALLDRECSSQGIQKTGNNSAFFQRCMLGLKIIEAVFGGVIKLFLEPFPSGTQRFRTPDDPSHVIRLMIAAQISAGITQATQNSNHPRGSFEASRFTRVCLFYFRANVFQ